MMRLHRSTPIQASQELLFSPGLQAGVALKEEMAFSPVHGAFTSTGDEKPDEWGFQQREECPNPGLKVGAELRTLHEFATQTGCVKTDEKSQWHTSVCGIVTCCLVLCTAMATSAADVPVFRWARDVELPALTATGVVAIELDEHFHAATNVDWSDYRLRDEQGHNVGSLLMKVNDVETQPTRESWSPKKLSVQVDEEHGLQVFITLDEKDPLPDTISIVTPLRDFEHQVRVDSAAGDLNWTPAGEPTLIFDYSQYIDARNINVPVKGGNHRRFRLTIADITAEQQSQLLEFNRRLRGGEESDRTERTTIQRRPFRVDRLMLSRTVDTVREKKTRTRTYPATDFAVRQNEKDKETIVTFAVAEQPLGGIRLLIADENFNRRARLEWEHVGSQGEKSWASHISGTLTRFQIGTIHRENLILESSGLDELQARSGPTHRADHYRIIIENGDSPPLNITGVEPLGPVYELNFLASSGQKLQLEYGSPLATAAQIDVAALQEAVNRGLPVLAAKLGEPRENTNASIAKPTWKPWNDPTVLFGGIVVLTLLLGWGLYRASNRVTLPPPGPST